MDRANTQDKEVQVGDSEQVTKEDVENERIRWLRKGDWVIVEYDMIHYPGEIVQVIPLPN